MRAAWSPVAAFVLLLAAGCAEDDGIGRVESRQEALVDRGSTVCGIAEASPVVQLAIEGLSETALELDRQGSLTLLVENSGDHDLDLTLRAITSSERGESASAPLGFGASAGATTRFVIRAAALELPTDAFNVSGSLTIAGDALFGREDAGLAPLTVRFHPIESGWAMYTEAGQRDLFDGGALTPSARATRAFAPIGARPGADPPELAAVHGAHVSDDPDYREPENTGDTDAEEVER